MNIKNEILKALCGIKRELVLDTTSIRDNGICNLVDDYLHYGILLHIYNVSDIKYTLRNIFKTWPKFSGDAAYPVPSDNPNITASYYYCLCNDHWDENTQYGRNRIDLLDWCINSLYMELHGI